MAEERHPPPALHIRLAERLQAIIGAYRALDDKTHHLIGLTLKVALVGYFIFCALFLSARYIVWPRIENYKGEIEQVASRTTGNAVSINAIAASWRGWYPQLTLDGVIVRDKGGQEALTLPRVSATISWWSVLVMDLRLHKLEIIRPDLDIRRDPRGNITIAGLLFDAGDSDDDAGPQWVLSQGEIAIRDGRLRWNDEMRKAPPLELEDVNVVLQNRGRRHRFLLNAKPPASLAAPLTISAEFRHPFFSRNIADVRQWKGVLFADLQHTDLVAWKSYVDYPFELNRGTGAVRAWLTLDHARVEDFTFDVALNNVWARLRKDLEPLDLVEVSGRISARELPGRSQDEKLAFGAYGHAVALTDFTLKTRDGLVLPSTTIAEEYVPGKAGEPGKASIKTRELDLQTVARFVKYMPLTADTRGMLADFAPSGQIRDFSLQWQGSYPDIASYQVNGQFIGLSMKAQPPRAARPASGKRPAQAAIPGIPGFENLTGRVEANQSGGNFSLASEKLVLHLPGYFTEVGMPFESLKMQANWAFLDKQQQFQFQIGSMNFVQEGIRGSLSGKHVRPLNLQDKSLGHLDMTGRIAEIDVKRIGRYLPLQMAEYGRKWLGGALKGGTAKDVQVHVKGDLADFPFAATQSGKPRGEFKVTMRIEDGVLDYKPDSTAKDGRSPLWPLAQKINGSLAFNGARMEIFADHAITHNVDLLNVSAVIPDLMADDMMLEINGTATGALQDFVHYANVSPVADWINNFTEDTRATGNAKLSLKFRMPLDRPKETAVHGTLQFLGNDVHLLHDLPVLTGAKGKLDFYETGFTLTGISAQFLGGPVAISGGTQANGKFRVNASGNLTVDGLRAAFPQLTPRIAGKARYSLSIHEKGRQPDIVLESNLKGVSLDFPAPLKKAVNDTLPLKVQVSSLAPAAGGVLRDDLRVSLGSSISARYQRQKGATKQSPWQVVRGGIGVNAPAPETGTGLAMKVAMNAIDVDTWQGVLGAVVGQKLSKKPEAQQTVDFSQYIDPDSLSAKTPTLTVAGLQLDNVDLVAEQRPGSWQIGLKSEQASGIINWVGSNSPQKEDRLTARLTALNISRTGASRAGDLLDVSAKPVRMPALDVIAEDFSLFGMKLGKFELDARNAPGTTGREWRIDKLVVANPDATLTASGHWNTRKAANLTRMTYSMQMANAGKQLQRFGFKDVLRDGKGKIDGSLEWKGAPFALDKSSLSGQWTLDIEKGQFLKAEPGVARLLGVMSLQTLPRRLTLDFRDIFSKGYAFDRITATATIANGTIKTENLKMMGASSTVLMEGTADIVQETQSLHVAVIPDINPNVASAVYGVVVNPVIGVGAILAQLALKAPLTKALTYEYRITGAWDQPTITPIKRTGDAAKQSPHNNDNEKGAS